jgi:hypothetical protein
MTGLSGTFNRPFSTVMRLPSSGVGTPLNVGIKANLLAVSQEFISARKFATANSAKLTNDNAIVADNGFESFVWKSAESNNRPMGESRKC